MQKDNYGKSEVHVKGDMLLPARLDLGIGSNDEVYF